MLQDKERQRIEALFADIEHLSLDPRNKTHQIQQELESLRARLVEIEKQVLHDHGANTEIIRRQSAGSMLYEKDQIGYTFSKDKLESLHDANKTVPRIQNALSSPLMVSNEAIGEMQIETPDQHNWTSEEMSLVHTVAQQASLQIQNLRLLSAAERARAEAESATRQFVHAGWESYLNAIERGERIGFAYDHTGVTPFSEKYAITHSSIQTPVSVMDEPVGALFVTPHPNSPWTASDKELMSSVANQVAQQVENIRLLADASRARAEAEEAIRRLTRDNWQSFTEDQETSAFVYDSLQVKPLEDSNVPRNIVLSQPLMVRGETVGQLAIAGWDNISPESAAITAAIAAQASIHLETLRLSEELQKRAKELEELDRLKSAFLANMSHELRTPLNSILGFTDVMLEGLDGELTEYMDNDLRLIQKNGQHLLHLINDVLDMAKIESGRMNLHPEKFAVHSILDEVTSITSTLASEKNLALFIEDDSDREIEVFADNTRLRQVMINLVNNSIKFTEKGKISLRASQLDGARVLIRVKDTGIGIPPEQLEAIFQEFTQVDTSTTRKVGGTGLGLPISRRLVEMHGGRLWAESTGVNGEGSTFFVELPLEARITEVIEKQEK